MIEVMENKKIDYNVEQITKMTEQEWQDFRKMRWEQKCQEFSDEKNIPDWFWPAKKDATDGIRQKTWIKRCHAYSNSSQIADWFIPNKEKYIEFLKKNISRKNKFKKTTENIKEE